MSQTFDFALKLYENIIKEETANIFFSPLSIYTALSMVYAGSRGNTAYQIKTALGIESETTFSSQSEEIAEIWGVITSNNKELTLNLANNLWFDKNFQVEESFTNLLEKDYKIKPSKGDFENESEKVRQDINNWVEKNTGTKIKNLIPENTINPLTKLILVNAIYFQGDWFHEFSKDATDFRSFFTLPNQPIDVEMMSQKSDFRYLEDESLDCKFISLPYKGVSVSMVIILPNQLDGLESLEKRITSTPNDGTFENSLAVLMSAPFVDVRITIPKFKFENSLSLKNHLSSIGITDVFSESPADLTGICKEKSGLHVSEGLHKAFINVDESGTEAAAATGMMMGITSVSEEKKYFFDADHPFLFMIYDEDCSCIMFMGRVVDLK